MALALVTAGLENGNSAEVIRGYRLMNRIEKDFPDDPALLTALGTILLKGKQPEEALRRFTRVTALRENYAPYRVNRAMALGALNRRPDAVLELREALRLDPLLQPAVELISRLLRDTGQAEEADRVMGEYRRQSGFRVP